MKYVERWIDKFGAIVVFCVCAWLTAAGVDGELKTLMIAAAGFLFGSTYVTLKKK